MRSPVHYCDPSAPYQKGKSFDELTQEEMLLMMNHLNSYTRKKLNDKSLYDTFSFLYGEDILGKLGYNPVPVGDINLTPRLLKK